MVMMDFQSRSTQAAAAAALRSERRVAVSANSGRIAAAYFLEVDALAARLTVGGS